MSFRTRTKKASHSKIRETASRMIREEGLTATSVHKVMERSGFTVGGFYAHFRSREQMIRRAFLEAVRQRQDLVMGLLQGRPPREWLPCFLKSYLTAGHVEDRENGCAWAALLSELPRTDATTRRMAERLFKSSVAFYEKAVAEGAVGASPDTGTASLSPREVALSSLAMAFGHLNLARMVLDPRLREEILATGLKASEALGALATRGAAAKSADQDRRTKS